MERRVNRDEPGVRGADTGGVPSRGFLFGGFTADGGGDTASCGETGGVGEVDTGGEVSDSKRIVSQESRSKSTVEHVRVNEASSISDDSESRSSVRRSGVRVVASGLDDGARSVSDHLGILEQLEDLGALLELGHVESVVALVLEESLLLLCGVLVHDHAAAVGAVVKRDVPGPTGLV